MSVRVRVRVRVGLGSVPGLGFGIRIVARLVATEPALQDEERALEAVVRVEGRPQLLDVGLRGRRIA